MQRLLTIPGIGLLTATAIVGFVGDLRRFPSGRRFSSYLGLVPKENSSGDIRRLGRITKRGDSYLRTLLTRGGRAVLRAANVSKSPPDKLRAWARKVHRSRGHNKAAIAVANKFARIVWAVSTRESEFQSVPAAARGARSLTKDDELHRVRQCAYRGTLREGRSLEDFEPTPTLARDRAHRHRAAPPEGDGRPTPSKAA